jgi:dienelactone hydrolase
MFGTREWYDSQAVYTALRSKPENAKKKIGFFGLSMGGATCLTTVGKTGYGDFVIASVPYASLDNLFRFQIKKTGFPIFPSFYFMKIAAMIEFGFNYDMFSPMNMIKNIHVPILIFSALHDEKVGNAGTKQLFQAANQPKIFWEAPTSHDIHRYASEEFERRIVTFLHKITS